MNKRFFGLDLHKKYAIIYGISQQGDETTPTTT